MFVFKGMDFFFQNTMKQHKYKAINHIMDWNLYYFHIGYRGFEYMYNCRRLLEVQCNKNSKCAQHTKHISIFVTVISVLEPCVCGVIENKCSFIHTLVYFLLLEEGNCFLNALE